MDSLSYKRSCDLAALVNQSYKVDLLQACVGNNKEAGQCNSQPLILALRKMVAAHLGQSRILMPGAAGEVSCSGKLRYNLYVAGKLCLWS